MERYYFNVRVTEGYERILESFILISIGIILGLLILILEKKLLRVLFIGLPLYLLAALMPPTAGIHVTALVSLISLIASWKMQR